MPLDEFKHNLKTISFYFFEKMFTTFISMKFFIVCFLFQIDKKKLIVLDRGWQTSIMQGDLWSSVVEKGCQQGLQEKFCKSEQNCFGAREQADTSLKIDWFVYFWCFNATFSSILTISWWQVLVVEEAGVSGENHRPWTNNW